MLKVSRGRIWKAQKVVVYGPEGIGKSTFAAQFPEPVFIDTEGSTNLMDVARLPRPASWNIMLSMINEIKNTPGFCKTLVIDTIDWAEQLCVAHVCALYNKKGIEDFGYGKGYVFVKEEFGRFLNLLNDIIDMGINVVLTAHSTIRKFELPDECGSYDRYELKLSNKTGAQVSGLVKEWADMVLFANYKQFVVEVDKKKKAQGGTRVMYAQHHPCWDAKNRHDLKPELPFEYAQIAYCIPNQTMESAPNVEIETNPRSEITTTEESSSISTNAAAPATTADIMQKDDEVAAATPTPAHQAPVSEKRTGKGTKKRDKGITGPGDLKDLPEPLADLMTANSVTVEEIQHAVALKGYYPKDTPIKNYDPAFVDGVLVGAWSAVFAVIQEEREIPF